MSSIILKEISQFKVEFERGGLTLEEYIRKSKSIKQHIEDIAEEKIDQLRQMLFRNIIDMEEYRKLKFKVEKSRKYYKQLLYW